MNLAFFPVKVGLLVAAKTGLIIFTAVGVPLALAIAVYSGTVHLCDQRERYGR